MHVRLTCPPEIRNADILFEAIDCTPGPASAKRVLKAFADLPARDEAAADQQARLEAVLAGGRGLQGLGARRRPGRARWRPRSFWMSSCRIA